MLNIVLLHLGRGRSVKEGGRLQFLSFHDVLPLLDLAKT